MKNHVDNKLKSLKTIIQEIHHITLDEPSLEMSWNALSRSKQALEDSWTHSLFDYEPSTFQVVLNGRTKQEVDDE